MSPEELKQAQAICDAATPHKSFFFYRKSLMPEQPEFSFVVGYSIHKKGYSQSTTDADCYFLAAAAIGWPKALAAIEKAAICEAQLINKLAASEAEIERLKKIIVDTVTEVDQSHDREDVFRSALSEIANIDIKNGYDGFKAHDAITRARKYLEGK